MSVEIHGGHDRGIWEGPITPRLHGGPRTRNGRHYEWDVYELKRRRDGTYIYLWTETRACCYTARVKGMQPVAPA